MEVALPAGLYGMAIAEPAQLDRQLDGKLVYYVEVVRVQSMLLLNYVVMCLFIFEIWAMDHRREVAECAGNLLLLEIMCVFLFEVRMLIDMRKAINIIWLLWAAPEPAAPSASSTLLGGSRSRNPKAGAVLANEEPEQENLLRRMVYASRRRSQSDPSETQWKLDGISQKYRLWCLLSVGIPKLLVSFILAHLGGRYIIGSPSDSAMVVSTASVVFIAEIETLLYEAFTSDVMRHNLEHMQPVELSLTNRRRLSGWLVNSLLSPVLTMCFAMLVVYNARHLDCHDLTWTAREVMSGFQLRLRGAVAH